MVFVLTFILNTEILQATEGSDDASVEVQTTTEIKTEALNPIQKREREKARMDLKREVEDKRLEIKDTRDEMEIKRNQLREELRLKLEGRMEERAEHREEAKEERQEKKEEMKGTAEEMRIRARTWVANALLQRAENLAQISTRIKTRIEKLKADGVDTAAATAFVVQADASIELSKVNAQKVKDGVTNGDTLETIKINIDASKEAMKEAHGYLRQAVESLKTKIELKIEAAVNASI